MRWGMCKIWDSEEGQEIYIPDFDGKTSRKDYNFKT